MEFKTGSKSIASFVKLNLIKRQGSNLQYLRHAQQFESWVVALDRPEPLCYRMHFYVISQLNNDNNNNNNNNNNINENDDNYETKDNDDDYDYD